MTRRALAVSHRKPARGRQGFGLGLVGTPSANDDGRPFEARIEPEPCRRHAGFIILGIHKSSFYSAAALACPCEA